MNPPGNLSCFYCKEVFATVTSLLYHHSGRWCPNGPMLQGGFQCGNCDSKLTNFKSFTTHVHKMHKQPMLVSPCRSLPRTPMTTPLALRQVELERTPVRGSEPPPSPLPQSHVVQLNDAAACGIMSALFGGVIADLHSNPGITDKSVQRTVMATKQSLAYVCDMLDQLHEEFTSQLVGRESCEHLEAYIAFAKGAVQKWVDPLDSVHKRWQYFLSTGALIAPETVTLTTRKTVTGLDVPEKLKDFSGQFVPMGKNLKNILQIPGLFEEVMEYASVISGSEQIQHFTQGSAWIQETKRQPLPVNSYLFPINIYFDDFETGNPLGSHAGSVRKLGGVYMTLPFLPPRLASKLDFILLVMIFSSKHRKEKGRVANNFRIFKWIISEMNDLRNVGIDVTLANGSTVNVKFALGCLLGDNLGLNEMLGFTTSFSALRCCRFCRATKHDFGTLTVEDPALMRNATNYQADYSRWLRTGATDSGIVGENVWLELKTFAIDRNVTVDVMHDIFEGVARYAMQVVLKGLIVVNKAFGLPFLNSRITNLHYGPDVHSKPPTIRQQGSRTSDFGIRMSASEMHTFITYFGIMVGHMIRPVDSSSEEDTSDSGLDSPPPRKKPRLDDSASFFRLYTLLREIVSICCSDSVTQWKVAHVRLLIREFLVLYMRLSGIVRGLGHQRECDDDDDDDEEWGDGKLPPKFHFLTHYPAMMMKVGPLNPLSSMRPEGKHKFVKKALTSVSSSVNPPLTAAKKVQLSNMAMIMKNELPPRLYTVAKLRSVSEIRNPVLRARIAASAQRLRASLAIDDLDEIRYTRFITTPDGVRFSPEDAVCVGMCGDPEYPAFAEIIHFFCTVPNKKIFFEAYNFETIFFSEHYGTYRVAYGGNKSFHQLDNYIRAYPFPNTVIEGPDGNTHVLCRNSV